MKQSATPLILCVDDDKVTLRVIERSLRNTGYGVLTAEGGNQALERLETTTPDLILLDAVMPGMDGYEVCARLRQHEELANIPVIFVTSLEQQEDKVRALALGAADYLPKPIQKDLLLGKVASHLETCARWQELQELNVEQPHQDSSSATPEDTLEQIPQDPAVRDIGLSPAAFSQFLQFLATRPSIPPSKKDKLAHITPPELYSLSSEFGISDSQVAQWIAEFLKLPYEPMVGPEKVALGVLPPPFCKTNLVVAINENPADLANPKRAFVLSNPFNWELLRILRKYQNPAQSLTLIITEPKSIQSLFEKAGTSVTREAKDVSISDIEVKLRERYQSAAEETDGALLVDPTEESEPLILLVNQLIESAYLSGASDIHIEPWEHEILVRNRIDGELRIVNRFKPRSLIRPLVSRLKVMSGLDIAERRLPQDGRIMFKKYTTRGLDFDLRVASAPMNFGEKVVMRILDKNKAVMPLPDLGLSARHLALYREKIKTPYGMVLHVGPTGSGKSMTLYAALNEVQTPEVNIQTVEDPIEYTLPGINQLQVHREIGLTFSRALRSYLRQDPDVILVGEIRDRETADIAVEAALTGHLLLSTLHTNDAPSTVTRLVEMGIEPFMVSSSVVLVCAQRLMRRLCKACKEEYRPESEEKRLVGLPPDSEMILYRAKGCEACSHTGYKGRIGIHEMLVPNDEMRKAINQPGITAEALKRQAVETCAMTTLYWDAMEKVRQGITSVEEALSRVRKDEFDTRPDWMFEELGLEKPKNRDQIQ